MKYQTEPSSAINTGPNEGTFSVLLYLHSNAGTDQPEGWTTIEFSGEGVPAVIVEHILDRADYPGSHWGDVFWTDDGSLLTLMLEEFYRFDCRWKVDDSEGVVILLERVTRFEIERMARNDSPQKTDRSDAGEL